MKITGDEYFDQNEHFKDVLKLYEEGINSGRIPFMEVDDIVDVADYYNMAGMESEADHAADIGMKMFPGSTLPLVFKARRCLQHGDIFTAESYAGEIEDKTDLDYHFLRAELILADGRVIEAEQYFMKIYNEQEEDVQNDYCIDAAMIYNDYGQTELAWKWARMVSPDTDRPEFIELKGRLYVLSGEPEMALPLFQSLVDHYPMSENYWTLLACAQDEIGDHEGAVQSAQYALAINPTNNSLREFVEESEKDSF